MLRSISARLKGQAITSIGIARQPVRLLLRRSNALQGNRRCNFLMPMGILRISFELDTIIKKQRQLLALFFYPYRYWESACFSQEPSYSKDPTGDLLHGFAYDV